MCARGIIKLAHKQIFDFRSHEDLNKPRKRGHQFRRGSSFEMVHTRGIPGVGRGPGIEAECSFEMSLKVKFLLLVLQYVQCLI